ncbi:MAG: phosphoribosylglycinamide formyltransferase [Chloroflexota bacterium]|nr:phosphoribosylglycinamide formyltransferase [Anaerolineae bacterium]
MNRLAVLISGFGSNLQAVIDATEAGLLGDTRVTLVVSNRKNAYGLERAQEHGIPTVYHSLSWYRTNGRTRIEYDADLARVLRGADVDWVILAGWMHILSDAFLCQFPDRVINLHPASPGMFPGTDAIARAYEAYQRGEIEYTGCMVHLVPDEAVDAGPVLKKEIVPIYPEDSLEILEERMHRTEHRLLVDAIAEVLVPQPQMAKQAV